MRPPAAPSGCRVVCLACGAWCGCAWWFAWATAALLPLILPCVYWVCGVGGPAGGDRSPSECHVYLRRAWCVSGGVFFSLCHRSLSLFPHFSLFPPPLYIRPLNINCTRYAAHVQVTLLGCSNPAFSCQAQATAVAVFSLPFLMVRLLGRASLFTAFVPLAWAVCKRVFSCEGLIGCAACVFIVAMQTFKACSVPITILMSANGVAVAFEPFNPSFVYIIQ